jgi:pyridinium-3,5-bisthiocarboxylic acid mononucleotide nickel chelatase
MKYAFFDGSSGLSGDMILGALLDLGVGPRRFKEAMAGLRLPVAISVKRVRRGALGAAKVDVLVRGRRPVERTFADVERVILRGRFPSAVKDRAVAVFRRLFEAEAKVHGRRFKDTHLHEAGADDALVDIVGFAWLAEELGIGEFLVAPLNVGSGWVKTAHGVLPVPPPAVAELLKGYPVYSAWVESELVTPTGAAIVSTLARPLLRLPELVYERIGCGAGTKDFDELANVLRVFYGEAGRLGPGREVQVIEATLDDANPQLLAHFLETALEEGALDATLSPVVMKKNRLGTKLTLLAPIDRMDRLIEAVFRETTSIGVRYYPVGRRVLEREFRTVRVAGEAVRVKLGRLGGREVNAQPEYEDCLKAARRTGRPLKDILRLAVAASAKRK